MDNVILTKSFEFAVKSVNLCRYLKEEKRENVLSLQMLRSSTSIGANVKEAEKSQSDADFYYKLSIALKEANETEYWLQLLYATDYLGEHKYKEMQTEVSELISILVSITKTMKKKIENSKF